MDSFLLIAVLALLANSVRGQQSVSGFSSGGFMAVQYHVAYSSQLDGAGIIAGGPYYCAQGSLITAVTTCMTIPSGINLNTLYSYVTSQASLGNIDNPSNLKQQKVWLFSGTKDTTVVPGVMSSLETFYNNYVPQSNIAVHFNLSAQHCFPTNDFGNSCNYLGTPYINNCNFDGAGSLLQQIYGPLKNHHNASDNNLLTLSQSSYLPFGWTISSASVGSQAYYYLPSKGCTEDVPCKLHISFHGCLETLADIGMKFVEDAGYNDWAESSNIIVLYPQAAKSIFLPSNPNGCWDWFGYTNGNYANNEGVQMQMVNSMVKYLSSKYTIN